MRVQLAARIALRFIPLLPLPDSRPQQQGSNIVMNTGTSRRQRNAIRDSDLPKKRSHPDSGHVLSPTRPLKDRYKSETDKPTPSELEEAQLLIGAAAGSMNHANSMGGEEQVVYLVNESDVQAGSSGGVDQAEEPAKPELTEEELRIELQALLDSQLEPRPDDEDSDSRHLIKNRDQLESDHMPDGDADGENTASVPSKGFSANEIQAFMNHQIKKQHQQQIMDESQEVHMNRHPQQQQQLVLITSNGEKIILISNPNGNDGGSEDGDAAGGDYQAVKTEIDEQEEQQIQSQHRRRQQMLLMQLDRLREQHKQRLPASVTTPAVPHLQPITLVPYPKPEVELNDETGTFESEESGPRLSGRSKAKKPLRKRDGEFPKWLRPINNYLSLATKYVKRREDKIDEVAKSFPSSSATFEKRCQELKQEFLKIELTIERFQNTVGKDLEEASAKFHSFLRDQYLDSCIGEIEAEDETDEFDCNLFEPEEVDKPKARRFTKKSLIAGDGSTDMQIITPSNISITSAAATQDFETNCIDTSAGADGNEDPFEFTPEPEPLVDVKPVPNSAAKSASDKSIESQRPVRSARLQNRKKAEEPIRSPSRRRASGRR